MTRNPSVRRLASTAAAVALAVAGGILGSTAWASGSEGSGPAETGDTAAYNTGKGVFATRLACKSCPLAGKTLDAAMARELIGQKPASVTLLPEEARALDVYLKRRFKL